ncbi:hypothetical protein [Amycolatopsis sp. NPDC051061]
MRAVNHRAGQRAVPERVGAVDELVARPDQQLERRPGEQRRGGTS